MYWLSLLTAGYPAFLYLTAKAVLQNDKIALTRQHVLWRDELIIDRLTLIFHLVMSTVVTFPKNGNVARPNLNSWIVDWFDRDLSSVFSTNFNMGMKKSDFAENEMEHEDKGENYSRREFGYSSFRRRFLPKTVEDGKIRVKCNEGILSASIFLKKLCETSHQFDHKTKGIIETGA